MMEVGEGGQSEECLYLSADEAEKRLPLLAQVIILHSTVHKNVSIDRRLTLWQRQRQSR